MAEWQIRTGDVRRELAVVPDASLQTVVTSPPYWGLRDYGHDDQLGLEPTPEQYVENMVEVFRAVRRVLRDDGTLWLNLGDSYMGGGGGNYGSGASTASDHGQHLTNVRNRPEFIKASGCKAKDLVGIPWAVAEAMRDPYYVGQIASERDRVWLAATMDAEGSICGSTHVRKDNGQTRTSLNISITNADVRMLDEAQRIWPTSRQEHNRHGDGHLGNRPTFRWIPHGAEAKGLLCRELLPYLVVKRKQALLGWRFCELSKDAKRLARSPQATEATEQRAWIMDALSRLNRGEDVDIPTWVGEPPSLTEPGWYLRSDIIWAKPNPMPESVTDRPTKAHEYLFLLTKGPRYFYDADAIREESIYPDDDRALRSSESQKRMPTEKVAGIRPGSGTYPRRNKRSVWTVTTQPFPGAHFATFPPKLIEPCILAGTPSRVCAACGAPWVRERIRTDEPDASAKGSTFDGGKTGARDGGERTQSGERYRTIAGASRPSCDHGTDHRAATVLDPFNGAGTTGLVALQRGRDYIGIELNPEYAEMARERIRAWEANPAGHLEGDPEPLDGQMELL